LLAVNKRARQVDPGEISIVGRPTGSGDRVNNATAERQLDNARVNYGTHDMKHDDL
jgi:hypothetical protein